MLTQRGLQVMNKLSTKKTDGIVTFIIECNKAIESKE
ncbi:hypothetical protein AJ90_21245 [Vibrio parahaemolyticus M0605]|nr:hypothetical protein AJ90_21245 [Vibrio parahaemolyticus M0605]